MFLCRTRVQIDVQGSISRVQEGTRLRQCVTLSNDVTHRFSICTIRWRMKVMKSRKKRKL